MSTWRTLVSPQASRLSEAHTLHVCLLPLHPGYAIPLQISLCFSTELGAWVRQSRFALVTCNCSTRILAQAYLPGHPVYSSKCAAHDALPLYHAQGSVEDCQHGVAPAVSECGEDEEGPCGSGRGE